MNEPKRYEVTESYNLGDMREDAQGNYVRYEDYARLKAEVDMLKASSRGHSTTHLYQRMAEENARLKAECQARQAENSVLAVECDNLKAEVERLTKAGDMCDQLLACFEMEGRRGVNIGRDMWREAKGVQS
jgi:hypothetical protein